MTTGAGPAMKKRPPTLLAIRRHFWLGLQLVTFLSVLICLVSLLRMQSQSPSPSEILSSSSSIATQPFAGVPKIAFLFLARSSLPLDFVWQTFFQNADVANFSIYIHSQPGFVFDSTTTRSTFFYGRQISNSVQVAWGESTMIEAERMLLSSALEDLANQRFVLISDSCVPLYNFSYIYNYLMSSSKSFVDSFLDTKSSRYNPKMSSNIPKDKWRKGSQWIALVRRHAEVVAADDAIFPVFKTYCKRRPALDLKGKHNTKPVVQKEHNCIPDEHYIQTLLSMNELESELERRSLTYTSWNQSKTEVGKQSWHPMMFEYASASPDQIGELKSINHVYYETESRTEWCQNNATSVPCFLFARKFSRGGAMRLLNEGFVGPFNAAALLTSSSS